MSRAWWEVGDRSKLRYYKEASKAKPIEFQHTRDMDTNGVLHWIGTGGLRGNPWKNPCQAGLVEAWSSDDPSGSSGGGMAFGQSSDVVGRSLANCHTKNRRESWIAIDLGLKVVPEVPADPFWTYQPS